MNSVRSILLVSCISFATLFGDQVQGAQYLDPTNAQRSYGAGVVTEGGRVVWLAGMGGTRAAGGEKITNFGETDASGVSQH
jgi:hypothetical protein